MCPPDLGPKIYSAYGQRLDCGTTGLHMDISDAVNILVGCIVICLIITLSVDLDEDTNAMNEIVNKIFHILSLCYMQVHVGQAHKGNLPESALEDELESVASWWDPYLQR